jgi:pilus assembly protein Flp/PilA
MFPPYLPCSFGAGRARLSFRIASFPASQPNGIGREVVGPLGPLCTGPLGLIGAAGRARSSADRCQSTKTANATDNYYQLHRLEAEQLTFEVTVLLTFVIYSFCPHFQTDGSMYSLISLLCRGKDEGLRYWAAFRLIRDRSGVTAIEYGLIAALIAVAAVAVMTTVGTNLSRTFSTVATKL